MCVGDMTLEWARVDDDGGRRAVDGWGVTHHQCKAWEDIEEWMEENWWKHSSSS